MTPADGTSNVAPRTAQYITSADDGTKDGEICIVSSVCIANVCFAFTNKLIIHKQLKHEDGEIYLKSEQLTTVPDVKRNHVGQKTRKNGF